jgi:hypothetical protein
MSNKEKQQAFRHRKYSSGLKPISFWIPRETEDSTAHINRKTFIQKLDDLTAGFTKEYLSKIFSLLINIVKYNCKQK